DSNGRLGMRVHGVCFFFQAEDGIRDFHVTGVQTCALPIFTLPTSTSSAVTSAPIYTMPESSRRLSWVSARLLMSRVISSGPNFRSEERRVGKECRSSGMTLDHKSAPLWSCERVHQWQLYTA